MRWLRWSQKASELLEVETVEVKERIGGLHAVEAHRRVTCGRGPSQFLYPTLEFGNDGLGCGLL
jgi:hypothetical protein